MHCPTSNDDNKMTSAFRCDFFIKTHPNTCPKSHKYLTKEYLQMKILGDSVLEAMSQILSYGCAHFYHVLHRLSNLDVGPIV